MKVIFLDVDGVLNSTRSMIAWHEESKAFWQKPRPEDSEKSHQAMNHIDPIAVKLLNRVTDKSGAVYVISSTHRKHIPDSAGNGRDIQRMQDYFNKFGLTGKVIGYTPCSRNGHRGTEIDTWLADNHSPDINKYAIIDDDSDMFEYQKPYFVHTSQEDGFMYKHYKELIKILDFDDSP